MAKRHQFGRAGNLTQQKPKWSRSFGFIAFLAALLGLVSIGLAPIIFVVGMISIIGIPIAILAVVFPTLCLTTVIAYLVFRIRPQLTFFGVARSYVIAILTMLAVPQINNMQVRGTVEELRAGDKQATLAKLNQQDNLVVFTRGRSPSKCFQLCLDLLLSGQTTSYITANIPRKSTQHVGNEEAIIHRLVKEQKCENEMALPKNRTHNENKPGTVAFQLKEAAARGICLHSTRVTLSDIDKFRAVAHFDRNDLDYTKSVFLIDTMISPSRVAVYEKPTGGALSLVAQQTNVSYSLLKPLLAYSISGGQISNVSSSWWRERVSANYLSLDAFLTDFMGARLRKN